MVYIIFPSGKSRALYRLGESEYGAAFILKGAMLFPLWGMDEHRPTRDADLLGFGESTEAHRTLQMRG